MCTQMLIMKMLSLDVILQRYIHERRYQWLSIITIKVDIQNSNIEIITNS